MKSNEVDDPVKLSILLPAVEANAQTQAVLDFYKNVTPEIILIAEKIKQAIEKGVFSITCLKITREYVPSRGRIVDVLSTHGYHVETYQQDMINIFWTNRDMKSAEATESDEVRNSDSHGHAY